MRLIIAFTMLFLSYVATSIKLSLLVLSWYGFVRSLDVVLCPHRSKYLILCLRWRLDIPAYKIDHERLTAASSVACLYTFCST